MKKLKKEIIFLSKLKNKAIEGSYVYEHVVNTIEFYDLLNNKISKLRKIIKLNKNL